MLAQILHLKCFNMSMQSTLLALFVVFIWGANFVVVKIGVTEIPPIALLAIRYSLAGLVFLPFVQWPGWTKFKWCVLQGVFLGVLHQGTMFYSLTIMPAGLSSLILQSSIILVTLMGWFFFKEKIGWRTWLGISVGLFGVAILMGGPTEGTTSLGLTLIVLSTIFVSFTYIIMKKLGKVHPATYIVFLSLPVAPIIIIMSLFIEGTNWISAPQDINWPLLSFVIFFEVIILSYSHIIWQKLMAKEPMSQMMPFTLLAPLIGLITAVIVLDEALTVSIIIGGLLTILGVTIITFRQAKKGLTLPLRDGN